LLLLIKYLAALLDMCWHTVALRMPSRTSRHWIGTWVDTKTGLDDAEKSPLSLPEITSFARSSSP
jgi:hypothetical protein